MKISTIAIYGFSLLCTLFTGSSAWAVSCPPAAGDGAVRIRDLDGDNVKDFRFDAAAGANKRTEVDEAGNRKELWCLDHGAGSSFVWMYIAAAGEPGAGKNKYIGYCEFDGGGNVRTEKLDKVGGKRKFISTRHVNTDRFNRDPVRDKRIYDFDVATCKITQTSVLDNGMTVVDHDKVDAPSEDGRMVGLPIPPARRQQVTLLAIEDSYVEPLDDPIQDDTSTCDVNGDGKIDSTDVNTIFLARGTPASPGDPRDPDLDGMITSNDARICAVQCTKPLCAP